jgi:ribosomal protein S18 acetylase RimI-like enzyme
MPIAVRLADYAAPADAKAVLDLLDGYARDPMGDGAPLDPVVRSRLLPLLAARAGAFSVLAYGQDAPVGLANCFEGFSTFAAKPLINIHDVFVTPAARGRGVVGALFAEIARIGRARGCCKITLEVLATNERAQAAYRREGFGGSAATLFWQKKLAP